jgi:hypothetical protein
VTEDPKRYRPNHYIHDSLGDPLTCTGDHNHPEPDCCGDPSAHEPLEPEVIETAKKANCSRCKIQIVGSPGLAGTVLYSLLVPLVGGRERGFLCGGCGLALKEFLHPELADDAMFQAVKLELQSRFL